jgi:hypothetical protein
VKRSWQTAIAGIRRCIPCHGREINVSYGINSLMSKVIDRLTDRYGKLYQGSDQCFILESGKNHAK